MTTRIAFLRAVNVGKRRVTSDQLRAVCEDLGYADVGTYINSGNAHFETTGSRASIEQAMGEALEKELGFECTTFVRTLTELKRALSAKPFDVADGDTYFITFLKDPPTAAQKSALEGLSGDIDTLVVLGRDVHWRMHGTSMESALTKRHWEKILGPLSSTSRNTTMLTKLAARLG